MYRVLYIYLLSAVISGTLITFDAQVVRSPKYSISHCLNSKTSYNILDETFYIETKSNVLLYGFYFLVMAKYENTKTLTLSNYSVTKNSDSSSFINRYEVHISNIKYVKRRFIYFVFYAEDPSYVQTPFTPVSCIVFIDNDTDAPRKEGEAQGTQGAILITGNMEDTIMALSHSMTFKYLDDYFLLICCEQDRNMNCIRHGKIKMASTSANGIVIHNIINYPTFILSSLVNGLQYECTKNFGDVTSLNPKTMTTTFELEYIGYIFSTSTSILYGSTSKNTADIINWQNLLMSSLFDVPIKYPESEENKATSTNINTTIKNEHISDVNMSFKNATESIQSKNNHDHNVNTTYKDPNIIVPVTMSEETTIINSTCETDNNRNENIPVTSSTEATETNERETTGYSSDNTKVPLLNARDGGLRSTCGSWSNNNAHTNQIIEYEVNDTLQINCTKPTKCYLTVWHKHDNVTTNILGACSCGENDENVCSLKSSNIMLTADDNNTCFNCNYTGSLSLEHSLRKLILKPNNRNADLSKPSNMKYTLIGLGCGATIIGLIGLILCWQRKVLQRLSKCRFGADTPRPGQPSLVLSPQNCNKELRERGQQIPFISPQPAHSTRASTPPLYESYEDEYEAVDYEQCHGHTNPPNDSSRLRAPAAPPIYLMPGKNEQPIQVRWKPPGAHRPAYTDSELMQLDDDGYQIPRKNNLALK